MVKELLAARAPVAWSPSNSRAELERGCSLFSRVVIGSSSDGPQNCINICKRIIMFTTKFTIVTAENPGPPLRQPLVSSPAGKTRHNPNARNPYSSLSFTILRSPTLSLQAPQLLQLRIKRTTLAGDSAQEGSCGMSFILAWKLQKIRRTFCRGVLVIRILASGVLYTGPIFAETPI